MTDKEKSIWCATHKCCACRYYINKKCRANVLDKPRGVYVELDGGFARCSTCWNEVDPRKNKYICPYCGQVLDWINMK